MNRRILIKALIAAALAAPLAFPASAQTWPTKAIKWINPFPAGGGTDVFARPMAAKLGAALGQSVFIEINAGSDDTVMVGDIDMDGKNEVFMADGSMGVRIYEITP